MARSSGRGLYTARLPFGPRQDRLIELTSERAVRREIDRLAERFRARLRKRGWSVKPVPRTITIVHPDGAESTTTIE